MNAIEVKNVSFSYVNGINVIDNISFNIEKGSYVTLIGRNGSGKSTLAKLICYLLEANSGEIKINNILLNESNIKEIRKNIGIVFQNPDNQFIGSTVEDDIAFGLENRNVPQEEMQRIVKEFAKKVNMEQYLSKEPGEISGGQKQRVAIAGILALGLKIIIFDEATSMLDPEGVKDIRELVKSMREENKDLTFISVTHDIEECTNCDKVIVLDKGKIALEGAPDEVFKNYKKISDLGLDIPYIYKIINELELENEIKVNDISEVAKLICK